MTCEQVRDAVSAVLDGERSPLDARVIESHLAGCAACRAFAAEAGDLHRTMRMAPAPAVPDLTRPILEAVGADASARHSRRRDRGLRISLALLGLLQLGVSLPALLGSEHGTEVHSSRHLGSFSIALAVGFLFTAWRPSRVAGLLPVVGALVVCVLGTSALDVVGGRTAATSEINHVTEVAGLVAAWLLGHSTFSGRSRLVTV